MTQDIDDAYIKACIWLVVAILGICVGSLAAYTLFFALMGLWNLIVNTARMLIKKCKGEQIRPDIEPEARDRTYIEEIGSAAPIEPRLFDNVNEDIHSESKDSIVTPPKRWNAVSQTSPSGRKLIHFNCFN